MNVQKTIRVIKKKYPDTDIVAIHRNNRVKKTMVVVNFPMVREVKLFSKTPKPFILKNSEPIIVIDVKFLIKKLLTFDPLSFVMFFSDEIYIDDMYELVYSELKKHLVTCIDHESYIDYAINAGDDLSGYVATIYKTFLESNDIESFRFTQSFDDSIEYLKEYEQELFDAIRDISISDGVCRKIVDELLLKIKLLNII